MVDKITILELKKANIIDKNKLKNIENELKLLTNILPGYKDICFYERLLNVNGELWKVEDKLRWCEQNKKFGKEFIFLARQVYRLNDTRSKIKKMINLKLKSNIVEEKSYSKY